MTASTLILFVGSTVVLSAWALYRTLRAEKASVAIRDAARQSGLVEPPSLHPVIDPERCIGCGSCVQACPEGNVLGMIEGKAELIEPTHCIGHGACATACAPGAIDLVFGTERRGIDIPRVDPRFQTNVPGIFIAGELGGMGLIRNAVEQGRQAMESIHELRLQGASDALDVVIVGAGPAGFSASLYALENKLTFVTLEQEALGGTVAHYPRGKIVMTSPVQLPLVGTVRLRETTKEHLLAFWHRIACDTGLRINYQERVETVQQEGALFRVVTNRDAYQARAVLLAIGRRGTPRKLDVPGEERTKVAYRLVEPDQYRGRRVLVVGGGDSALEAACACAETAGTTVAISYRSAAFGRAKPKNRERVEQLREQGRLAVMLESDVIEIGEDRVVLRHRGETVRLLNDAVIVCAGGILPTPFLTGIGIEVETKRGTA